MDEANRRLRKAAGILTVILLVVKLITLIFGDPHIRVAAGYPPPDLSVPEPKTDAERKAAEQRDKSFADFMAAVHKAQDGK